MSRSKVKPILSEGTINAPMHVKSEVYITNVLSTDRIISNFWPLFIPNKGTYCRYLHGIQRASGIWQHQNNIPSPTPVEEGVEE